MYKLVAGEIKGERDRYCLIHLKSKIMQHPYGDYRKSESSGLSVTSEHSDLQEVLCAGV